MNFQMTAGADHRDRHGQEDDRLGELLEAAAVGQHRDQQAEDDAESGAEDDPQEVIAER